MKRVFVILFVQTFLQSQVIYAQINTPEFLWTRQISSEQQEVAYALCTDSLGNVYVVGSTGKVNDPNQTESPDTTRFDDSLLFRDSSCMFVASYDKLGHFRWAKRLNQESIEGIHNGQIAYDGHGHIYIACDNYLSVRMPDTTFAVGSAFTMLMKLDTTGKFVWLRSTDGPRTSAASSAAVMVDAAGDVIWVGDFTDSVSFGTTMLRTDTWTASFVAKYNGAGELLWVSKFSANPLCSSKDAAIDRNGNIFLAGLFRDTIAIGDALIVTKGGYDIFVAKYSPDGFFQGVSTYGSAGSDHVHSIACDIDGYYFAGGFADSISFNADVSLIGSLSYLASVTGHNFLASADTNGKVRWARHFANADSLDDWVFLYSKVTVSPSRVLLLTGLINGPTVLGESEILNADSSYARFVLALDSDGRYLWSKEIGGEFGGAVAGPRTELAIYADSTIYTSSSLGSLTGIVFGDTTLITANTPTNDFDIFISQLGYRSFSGLSHSPGSDLTLKIFPNPGRHGNNIYADVSEQFMGKEISVKILSTLGIEVTNFHTYQETTLLVLPTNDLASGSYIVQIQAGDTVARSVFHLFR